MKEKQRNGWVVLAALYYYSIVAAFNLLKAPPLFGLLMDSFGLSEGTVGIIVSASSIAGLSIVFPSAFIARKLGTRRTGQLAICFSVTGCLLGAFAPNLPILLLARLIEGIGLGVTGVVGSTTIPQYFKGKKLGLPMSIWSTWFFVGSALGSLLSGRVGHYFENWRVSWLLGAAMAAIGFVIFSLFVYENKTDAPIHAHAVQPAPAPSPTGKQPSIFGLGIKNLRIWCISIFYATLLVSLVGFLSFGTEFFSSVFGMEKAAASAFASLGYWFSVVGSVCAGIVSRVRRGNSLSGQFVQMVVCAALCIVVYPFGFLVPQQYMFWYLVAAGLVNGYTCGVIFGTVPRLVRDPRATGVSMGIIFVCQNISSFSASLVVGACVEGGNWNGAVIPLLCIAAAGLILAVTSAVLSLRKEKQMQRAALPTKEDFEQLKQELESSTAALQAAREERSALQQEYDRVQEQLTALQAETDGLRKTAELAQAELVKVQAESAQYLQNTKLAVERELAAQRQVQELKHQLNVLKRMNPVKRMFWKG